MFQRVGLALSMAGSVLSASFWRVDVHCACLVAFSLCQATLCFFSCFAVFHQYSLFSPSFRRRFFPTVRVRHLILSGLGALPWLDLCVWTELQLLLSCSVFGKTFLNAGLPGLAPRSCVGICFGLFHVLACAMGVCVLVDVSSP